MQPGPCRPKLLIADDEEWFRSRLQAVLELANYEVLIAADGVEALAQVETERPNGILLDVMMPRMDGFAVLARLKANPHTASIPVILLLGALAEAGEYPAISPPGEVILCEGTALVVIKPLLKSLWEIVEALSQLDFCNSAPDLFTAEDAEKRGEF